MLPGGIIRLGPTVANPKHHSALVGSAQLVDNAKPDLVFAIEHRRRHNDTLALCRETLQPSRVSVQRSPLVSCDRHAQHWCRLACAGIECNRSFSVKNVNPRFWNIPESDEPVLLS